MKGIVLKQIGTVELQECPEPELQNSGDAIVRVTAAGICGSDLHIIHGRDAGVKPGTIMGHEFTGVVVDAGLDVSGFRTGDRVVAPFTVNCGDCFFCLRGLPARCIHSTGFGFVTEDGKGLQGAQTEFVRVPLASSTLMKIPSDVADEEALFLGDIFSTAYSTVEKAEIRKGDVLVVIGCGPVGLLSILAAKEFEPAHVVAVDKIDYRLKKARSLGATAVEPENADRVIRELTDQRGADGAVEAVGNPGALDLAIELVRPGAVISIAGYHTEPMYPFAIQKAYTKNLSVKIGRCNARKYMAQLLTLIQSKRVPLTQIITHVLPLSEGVRGYQIFDQRVDNAIKVLLKP